MDLLSEGHLDSRSFPLSGMDGSTALHTSMYIDRSSSEKARILHALAQLRTNKKEAGMDTEVTQGEVEAVVKNTVVRTIASV